MLSILLLCLRETGDLLPWAGDGAHHDYLLICYGVSGIVLLVRWAVIAQAPSGTSGRCTSQKIAEQLHTRGLCSAFRHPLYVGNFIAMLGIFRATMLLKALALFMLGYWRYIQRIMLAEVCFPELKFGNECKKWANTKPAFS